MRSLIKQDQNGLSLTSKASNRIDKPTLRDISKDHGFEVTVKFIANAIDKAAAMLQIETPYSMELAEDIVEKYPFESMETIIEALKRGRRGDYGTTYLKLNGIVISDWLSKVIEENAALLETRHKNNDQKQIAPSLQRTPEEIEANKKKYLPKLKEAVANIQKEDRKKNPVKRLPYRPETDSSEVNKRFKDLQMKYRGGKPFDQSDKDFMQKYNIQIVKGKFYTSI